MAQSGQSELGVPLLNRGAFVVPRAQPTPTPAPAAPQQAVAAPAPIPPPPAPTLTDALIVQAFTNTPFAKPRATVQPVDGRTLVTLDTYVQTAWEEAGFEPGEISTVDLLGHQVDIRPKGQSYTYSFGDGATIGPVDDAGGPYPTGTVKHAYRRVGSYQIRVTATYSGEYRVDGGPWVPITQTVDIPGPATPLDVRASRNELITSD